jgi:hypothetical protein
MIAPPDHIVALADLRFIAGSSIISGFREGKRTCQRLQLPFFLNSRLAYNFLLSLVLSACSLAYKHLLRRPLPVTLLLLGIFLSHNVQLGTDVKRKQQRVCQT